MRRCVEYSGKNSYQPTAMQREYNCRKELKERLEPNRRYVHVYYTTQPHNCWTKIGKVLMGSLRRTKAVPDLDWSPPKRFKLRPFVCLAHSLGIVHSGSCVLGRYQYILVCTCIFHLTACLASYILRKKIYLHYTRPACMHFIRQSSPITITYHHQFSPSPIIY